jgi:hypothetical protein
MESPVTSTASSGANVTWTKVYRRAHRSAGWWGVFDTLGHQLHLPRLLMKPICDHYDITLGIPRDDIIAMDYNGRAPWWLRKGH